MAHWQFNFRSGFDSEEEEECSSREKYQATGTGLSQHDVLSGSFASSGDSISKQLQDLFGSAEEGTVKYKPNPWNIAKINANARASSITHVKPKQPAGKAPNASQGGHGKTSFPRAGNSRFKKFEVEAQSAVAPLEKPAIQPQGSTNRSRGIRDSILAALRRNAVTPTKPMTDNHPRVDTIASEKSIPPHLLVDPVRDRGAISSAMPKTDSYVTNDPTKAPCPASPAPQDPGAYIHTDDTRLLSAEDHIDYCADLARDVYGSPTPSLTWNEPSSDIASVEDYPFSKSGLHDRPCHHQADGFDIYSDFVASPPTLKITSTKPLSQYLPNNEAGYYAQNGLYDKRSYTVNRTLACSPAIMETSPTLQLITKFLSKPQLAPEEIDRSSHSGYSQDSYHLQGSPTFAWNPRAPAPEQSSSKTDWSNTGHFQNEHSHRALAVDPSDPVATTRSHVLTNPPRKTTRKRINPIYSLDLDEEPVWSTLPSRKTKKAIKTPTNEIKTSRFRLPGSFIGSSPLGDSSAASNVKSLYKPPVRKRSRSHGGDESEVRWKVTRIA